jgi:predicted phage tail protein
MIDTSNETRMRDPRPIQRNVPPSSTSEPGTTDLFRSLLTDIRLWFRQETELAKTELSEKASQASRNAAFVAAGALTAYAGVIVLLLAIAGALAAGFTAMGMGLTAASFLASFLTAAVVILIGAAMIQKGKSKLKPSELTPDRTASTLRHARQVAEHKSTI